MTLKIQTRSIDTLIPYENNAKEHPESDVKFKTIPCYVDYEASPCGKIRSKKTGIVLKPKVQRYESVGLFIDKRYKYHNIHRLIAMTYLGAPPTEKHQAAHYDGDNFNNHVSNLRWATVKENMADKKRHGTLRGAHPGEKHHNSKLSDNIVKQMREARKSGHKFKSIADKYNVKFSTAYDAIVGKSWVHVK